MTTHMLSGCTQFVRRSPAVLQLMPGSAQRRRLCLRMWRWTAQLCCRDGTSSCCNWQHPWASAAAAACQQHCSLPQRCGHRRMDVCQLMRGTLQQQHSICQALQWVAVQLMPQLACIEDGTCLILCCMWRASVLFAWALQAIVACIVLGSHMLGGEVKLSCTVRRQTAFWDALQQLLQQGIVPSGPGGDGVVQLAKLFPRFVDEHLSAQHQQQHHQQQQPPTQRVHDADLPIASSTAELQQQPVCGSEQLLSWRNSQAAAAVEAGEGHGPRKEFFEAVAANWTATNTGQVSASWEKGLDLAGPAVQSSKACSRTTNLHRTAADSNAEPPSPQHVSLCVCICTCNCSLPFWCTWWSLAPGG